MTFIAIGTARLAACFTVKVAPCFSVREDPSQYTHHDQLFKQLIHTFFSEFLDLFLPNVYQHVDFSSFKPMSEEMFTDLFNGESRRADIVIEAKLKGQDTLIIIHVEPQSYGQPDFNERMYLYFSLLYNKYRKPILPIAIFSYDEIGMNVMSTTLPSHSFMF